jgi:hypothetical protein
MSQGLTNTVCIGGDRRQSPGYDRRGFADAVVHLLLPDDGQVATSRTSAPRLRSPGIYIGIT